MSDERAIKTALGALTSAVVCREPLTEQLESLRHQAFDAAESLAADLASCRSVLTRLTEACEARVVLNFEAPQAPAEHDAWRAVIVRHVNATEAARAALEAASTGGGE